MPRVSRPTPAERSLITLLAEFEEYATDFRHEGEEGLITLYDSFVRWRWTHGRTRLTNFLHLKKYRPVPGAFLEAVVRVRDHFTEKVLIDEAGFSHRLDRVYSAIFAIAIITGKCVAHIASCVDLRFRRTSGKVPSTLKIKWGHRKGHTTPTKASLRD